MTPGKRAEKKKWVAQNTKKLNLDWGEPMGKLAQQKRAASRLGRNLEQKKKRIMRKRLRPEEN